MIPYVQLPTIPLVGSLKIEPFGVFVALGVWIAARIAKRSAEKEKLPVEPLMDFSFWALIGGVVGGHLLHIFAYHPEEITKLGVLQIFKVWDGLSSTGGVLGGIAAAVIFFRVRKMRFFMYGDALAIAVATGWAIARIGCFVVHDHPGVHTNFFLAVQFPDGPRHDLGLDDAILLFAIAGLIAFLRRQQWLVGAHMAVLGLIYGTGRFLLDLLRATPTDVGYADARYGGLTPAQFACIALVIWALFFFARWKMKKTAVAASA